MEFDQVLFAGLTALSTVSILLIATIGLAVIFGMMGVINLAHGEFITLGAFITLFVEGAGIPFVGAVLIATLAMAIYGALIEILIIRHLYGRLFDTLLATWGIGLVMYQGAVMIFGSYTSGVGLPVGTINIGQYSMSSYFGLLIILSLVISLAIYLIFVKTQYGVMSRAAIQNPEMASSVGISTSRLNTLTFSFGSALAGLAGGLLVPAFPATPDMGVAFVSKAFLAVVTAGPMIITGTVATLLGLGSVSSISGILFTSVVGDVVFFAITIIILRFFPNGISGGWRGKL